MARILHHHVQLMPLGSSKLHCCAEGPGLAIGFPAPNRVKGNQRHKVLVGGHGPPQEADSSRFYSCPGTVQRHQHCGPGDSGALGHGAVLAPTTPPGIRVCMLSLFSHVRLCDSRLHCPWNSPTRILEWVTMLSCRGSSRPRDRTQISYISRTCRQVLNH